VDGAGLPLSGKFTLGARGTYWGTTYGDAGQQTSTLVTTMVSETSGQTAVNVAMAAAGLPSGSGEVIENHYLFPQAKILRHHFDRVGINIDDYTIPLERTRHRLNPNGIHTALSVIPLSLQRESEQAVELNRPVEVFLQDRLPSRHVAARADVVQGQFRDHDLFLRRNGRGTAVVPGSGGGDVTVEPPALNEVGVEAVVQVAAERLRRRIHGRRVAPFANASGGRLSGPV